MFELGIEMFITAILFASIATIVFLWVYYDTLGKTVFEKKRQRNVFHCIHCGHVYTADIDVQEAICPRCGMDNIKLRF